MSAGPPEIAKGARIIDVDAWGQTEVLRAGTAQMGSRACRGMVIHILRCVPINPLFNGLTTMQHTSRGQPTRYRAVPTCWLELRNGVTPTHMTTAAR